MKKWSRPTVTTISEKELQEIILVQACSAYKCVLFYGQIEF